MPAFVPVTLSIERAFVELLCDNGSLSGLEVVPASDRDADVPPLHAFVLCVNANPLLPAGPIYKPDVVVTLVTNIHDHTQAVRERWLKAIQLRLRDVGLAMQDDGMEFLSKDGVRIKGIITTGMREISRDDQTGDTFDLTAGIIID
ncbi:MAG: hypothetical protein LBK99_16420 [Opitutaceae bacterium]|jgi:hypothetical protein|nr:hypothetical protein [Opitutaceae bacterium]